MRSDSAHERLASLLALCSVLDLANGLPGSKSLTTAVLAAELSLESGHAEPVARAAFFAGLLRHLGCTAFSARESLLGDDLRLRGEMLRGDSLDSAHVARAVAKSNDGLGSRALGLGRLLIQGQRLRADWYVESCGAARTLGAQLGLGEDVLAALDEVHERWDGRGGPRAVGGSELNRVGQLAQAAHVAALFSLDAGTNVAAEALRSASGRALDPKLAVSAAKLLAPGESSPEQRLDAVEHLLSRGDVALDLDAIAEVFGDFVDLQSPFTHGHSRQVADFSGRASVALGLTADEQRDLRRAACLHDLGQVTQHTSLWLSPRFTPTEWDEARQHVARGGAILTLAPSFDRAARWALLHHERLDGSGYPRRLDKHELDLGARILAAADVRAALGQQRPQRPAVSASELRMTLEREVSEGRLDRDVVEALGTLEPKRTTEFPLTGRELDVLRQLCLGLTNRQIAAVLGVSARTVQHHTIHIYRKLGVDSRAAATLIAVRAGAL